MSGKIICPKCNGNGYRNVWENTFEIKKIHIDCNYCRNQGEIDITEDVIKDLEQTTMIQ